MSRFSFREFLAWSQCASRAILARYPPRHLTQSGFLGPRGFFEEMPVERFEGVGRGKEPGTRGHPRTMMPAWT